MFSFFSKPKEQYKATLSNFRLENELSYPIRIIFYLTHCEQEKAEVGIIELPTQVDVINLTKSNDDGNCKIIFEGVEITFNSKHKVNDKCCPDCKKILDFPSYLAFDVYAQTETRITQKGGWGLIGSGDIIKEGELQIRSHYLEVEASALQCNIVIIGKVNIDKFEYPKMKTNFVLPSIELSDNDLEYIDKENELLHNTLFSKETFQRVRHKDVAIHSGRIIRDMYYYNFMPINATDDFLEAILEVGFALFSKYDKNIDFFQDDNILENAICSIIFSVTHWVVNKVDYQPDQIPAIDSHGRQIILDYEIFSLSQALYFETGDCEDLAFYVSSILLFIKNYTDGSSGGSSGGGFGTTIGGTTGKGRGSGSGTTDESLLKRSSKVLKNFVITNAVLQATSPECSGLVMLGRKDIKKEDKLKTECLLKLDQEEEETYKVYHVTCFLIANGYFKQMIGEKPSNKEIEFSKKHRIYIAEGTACCYPNPFAKEIINDNDIKMIDYVKKSTIVMDVCCTPIMYNSDKTNELFGGVAEIITDYDKDCRFYIPQIKDNNDGEIINGFLFRHFYDYPDSIKLLKCNDITDLMTCENYLRLNTMCPLPILDINVDNKKKVTEFVNWCQMQKKLQQQQQENNSNIFKYCLIPEVVLKQGNNIDCIDYAYIFKHPLLGEGKFGGWNVCLLKSNV